jgi:MSHA biogenesis protein MshJ
MSWWQHPQAQKLIQAYLKLSQRERSLLQVTLYTGVILLCVWLWFEPSWQQHQSATAEQQQLRSETQQLRQQLQALEQQPRRDPNAELQRIIEDEQQQLQQLRQRIGQLTDALVSPQQMLAVLRSLLQADQRLQLVALSNSTRERVELGEAYQDVRLYRHGLELTMTATYPGLVDYLNQLDQAPWQLYWQLLDYQVDQYPRGQVTLKVYTLSTQEEVIGG